MLSRFIFFIFFSVYLKFLQYSFVFTRDSVIFFVTYVAVFISLMASLNQNLPNGTADLDEKKTCNIMYFILFSTLEDFCVNPLTVAFHLACKSQVSINCLDTFVILAPYEVNPTCLLSINAVSFYILV